MRMRAGIFRLWLVASAGWIGYRAWESGLACPFAWALDVEDSVGPWCKYRDAAYYAELVAGMIGVPLLAAIAILAAAWVFAGFRAR